MSEDSPQQRPFAGLDPEVILGAVEAAGHVPNGGFIALNSYENRVYQVAMEAGRPLVAKFYRPGRWSDAQILEEHAFALELEALEIPVAPPLRDPDERTLLHHRGFRYALYERRRGDWPELGDRSTRMRLGRFLGRLHAVGEVRPFMHRPTLTTDEFGDQARAAVLANAGLPAGLPAGLNAAYATVTTMLLERVRAVFARVPSPRLLRLHGDCHPGNILWSDEGPCFVDLDDARNGPAMQDVWMLLSGEREEMRTQLADLLDGYLDFCDFDPRELALVEALRALRLVYYAAWLTRRWDDPAFPRSFPWFGTRAYWEEHVHTLREQIARLEQPPLAVL